MKSHQNLIFTRGSLEGDKYPVQED